MSVTVSESSLKTVVLLGSEVCHLIKAVLFGVQGEPCECGTIPTHSTWKTTMATSGKSAGPSSPHQKPLSVTCPAFARGKKVFQVVCNSKGNI